MQLGVQVKDLRHLLTDYMMERRKHCVKEALLALFVHALVLFTQTNTSGESIGGVQRAGPAKDVAGFTGG